MFPRILQKPLRYKKSFFLLGPRGTGKTHWVKQHLPDAIYINLLRTDQYTELLAQPSRLRLYIQPDFSGWVIIDEVQKVPELLDEVHDIIESTKITFVLTGSSARKLRKSGVNLLAGRAITYHMYPLTVGELGDRFSLATSLKYGHLPAVYSEPEPFDYLKSYVATYLREEVMQEGLTRNIAAFSRFLEVASFSQGEVINMSEIARECGIHQKVVTAYFDILEDILIASRIPVFSKRAKRKTIQHPKFYYFDVGVYQAIRPKGYLDSPRELDGAGLETLFYQEIRAVNEYYQLAYSIYYWRTQSKIEVDFILYGEKGLLVFEIKRTEYFDKKHLKALKAFQQEYPEATLFYIYCGSQNYYVDDITIIPITKALSMLPKLLGGE